MKRENEKVKKQTTIASTRVKVKKSVVRVVRFIALVIVAALTKIVQ